MISLDKIFVLASMIYNARLLHGEEPSPHLVAVDTFDLVDAIVSEMNRRNYPKEWEN